MLSAVFRRQCSIRGAICARLLPSMWCTITVDKYGSANVSGDIMKRLRLLLKRWCVKLSIRWQVDKWRMVGLATNAVFLCRSVREAGSRIRATEQNRWRYGCLLPYGARMTYWADAGRYDAWYLFPSGVCSSTALAVGPTRLASPTYQRGEPCVYRRARATA